MNQKADKQTDQLHITLKRYREALEMIAKHDGVNSHILPGKMSAEIAKAALEGK